MTKLVYALETLEATPQRVLQILRGIAGSLAIQAHLLSVGFTRADLEEGWGLLREACDLGVEELSEIEGAETLAPVIAALDAWDERGFLLVEATLSHRFPEQARFLMRGLAPADGPEAVVGIATLLDRLDALDSDPLREESREDDHAALEALEPRGLGKVERSSLRAQCERVANSTSKGLSNSSTAHGTRMARLTRLRGWYDEWAGLSRAVLTKPAHLVALGLSGRSSIA